MIGDFLSKLRKEPSIREEPTVSNSIASESIGLQDVDRLSELFNVSTSAGQYVNEKSSMKVAIVYACCRLISGAVAQMPIKVYRDVNGSRETVSDNPLVPLLNLQPTATFSAASFWEFLTAQMLLSGDGFAVILRNRNGVPIEILPVSARDVYVDQKVRRNLYSVRLNDRIFAFDQDDIIHLPNFGFDGQRSPSVIRSGAMKAIGVEMAMEDYASDFFENGAHQSIAIFKEGNWSDGDRETFRSEWEQRYATGSKSKNVPLVFPKSTKLQELSVSARDSQLLESREFQITDIARAFGLPSFMVNQEQKSTSWGTGVSEIGQVFLRYTMMPHIQRFENELNRKFFLRGDQYCKFSTGGLVKATIKDRYEAHKVALGGSNVPGFMSINEVRRLEDLPPFDGVEFEKPYTPQDGGSISEVQEPS